MKVRKKTLFVASIVILAGIVGLALFANSDDAPVTGYAVESALADNNVVPEALQDDFSESFEPHWGHMPITYRIENREDCGDREARRIDLAFKKIAEESQNAASFQEVEREEDIYIKCFPFNDPQKDLFLSDSGAIVTSAYDLEHEGNLIYSGIIYFFIPGPGDYIVSNCGTYPDVETFNILSVMGIPNSKENYHIMNPEASYCPGKINPDVVQTIKRIYS